MFITTKNPSDLTGYILKAFSRYKSTLVGIHKQQWKDEDIRGESTAQYTAAQYHYAIMLVVLVRLEVDRLSYLNYDWSYYVDKYNLVDLKERLSCIQPIGFESISLDNILTDFRLPTVYDDFETFAEGVEGMDVEILFEVEPGEAVEVTDPNLDILYASTIDWSYELANLTGCK